MTRRRGINEPRSAEDEAVGTGIFGTAFVQFLGWLLGNALGGHGNLGVVAGSVLWLAITVLLGDMEDPIDSGVFGGTCMTLTVQSIATVAGWLWWSAEWAFIAATLLMLFLDFLGEPTGEPLP